ncbi:hypothetical protein [Tsukamurella spumae]|uniref:HTH gntR-type domain-containing protein n=1 Tax=Tsukamurella spumae TaxID=44753 RepID=A0A846X5D2_9ACTN|nr:hypothetical protein [Tsukamurella spumae]NKY19519.1 hypothetical protein [Tsukamurella spumae]
MVVRKPEPGAAIDEVTDYLLALARSGQWKVGTRGPILDELNAEIFGADAGPRPGRAAYAPLIEAGMVEARKGAGGGHFLRPTEAVPQVNFSSKVDAVHAAARAAEASVGELTAAAGDLARQRLYVVELQDLRTPAANGKGGPATFGQSLHLSRLAAESFAVDYLTRLGEDEERARAAAALAGFAAADSSADWGIRIFGVALDGTVVDTSRRAAIAGTT